MKIGNFLVPEMRLDELLGSTLTKIYSTSKTEPIQSKVLAELLGYKFGTEPTLFKKINSMLAYGILEGRGIYNVTKLGVDLLYPESPEIEKQLKTEAIMKVEFWKKLYEKHGKNPPKEGLWVSLKNIAEVEPATAKELENRIYKWYTEDMAQVSEEFLEKKPLIPTESKDLSSNEGNTKVVSQQLVVPSTDQEKLEFGKSVLVLPKKDLKKEWEKLQKYMEIFLEDYQEPSVGEQMVSETKEEL